MWRVAKIVELDNANGPGLRTSVFLSGCRRHCPGCFNEIAWDFNYGVPFDDDVEDYIRDTLKNPWIEGLSILGGEPFEPENVVLATYLAMMAKGVGKTVWVWSGYTIEEIWAGDAPGRKLLEIVDTIVDGPFIQDQRDLTLEWRGSRNQRVIDVKKWMEKIMCNERERERERERSASKVPCIDLVATGERIKRLRIDAGLSENQLAKRCDIGRTVIYRYESGKGLPSVDSLVKLSHVFDVSIEDMLVIQYLDNKG